MKRPPYFSYAFALLGLTLTSTLISSYNSYYFVDVLGMSVAFATISKIAMVGFDTFNDLIVGYLSDNTHSKFGRRLPWLLGGTPLMLFVGAMLFAPTQTFPDSWLFPYFLILTLLFELFSSVVYVNYGALFPTLFKGTKQRLTASMLRQGLSVVGMGIGLIIPPLLVQGIGYSRAGIVYAFASGVIFFSSISRLTNQEIYFVEEKTPQVKFIRSFREIMKNKRFVFFSLSSASILSVNALLITTFPFYFRYVLNADAGTQSFILLTLFVSAMTAMYLWKKLIHIHGYLKAWLSAFIIYAVSMLLMAFSIGVEMSLVAAVGIGVAMTGILVVGDLRMAGIIDSDIQENHLNREAIYYAIHNFIQKMALSLSTIVFTTLGLSMGYVSGNQPGNNPALTFRILMGVFPFFLIVLGSALTFFQIKNLRESEKKPPSGG